VATQNSLMRHNKKICMKTLSFAILLVSFSFVGKFVAQTSRTITKLESPQVVKVDSNKHKTYIIHPDAARFAKEVYGDVELYQTQGHLDLYSKELFRVTIIDFDKNNANHVNAELLSEKAIKTKYNPALINDAFVKDFDAKQFNALKYYLNFMSTEHVYIRIDSCPNVIVCILPA
jgi:hypothetical protein